MVEGWVGGRRVGVLGVVRWLGRLITKDSEFELCCPSLTFKPSLVQIGLKLSILDFHIKPYQDKAKNGKVGILGWL